MDLLDDVGPGQNEQVVVTLQRLGVRGESLAPVVLFFEAPALDHRAHRTIDDQDAAGQEFAEGGACSDARLVRRRRASHPRSGALCVVRQR